MTDRPTLADRYAALDPAELTIDQVLTYTLIEQVTGLRDDVARERRGRRLSIQVIAVAGVLALIVGSLFAVDQWRDEAQTCRNRKEAAARIRSAIEVAVDTGGRSLGADRETRETLSEEVAAAVLEAYPPPDC